MIALRPVQWILRGSPGDFSYGQPYQIGATVVRVTDELAAITGALGKLYAGLRDEIGHELADRGFRRVVWEDGDGNVYDQDLTRYGVR